MTSLPVCQALESGSTITLDPGFYGDDNCKEPENAQARMSRNNYKKGKIILTLFGIFFIVLFAYYTIAGNSPRPSNAPWNAPMDLAFGNIQFNHPISFCHICVYFNSYKLYLEIFESMTFDKKSGNRFCINRFSDAMVVIKQLNLSKNSWKFISCQKSFRFWINLPFKS